jgi:CRISPR associated protein Cas1
MRFQRCLSCMSRSNRWSVHNSRQPDRERGSAAGLALDGNVTAHHLTEAPADGEAKAQILQACAAGGITIVLLDRSGRFQARIEGPTTGNVLLRRAQYCASDAPVEIVRGVVLGKLRTSAQYSCEV